MKRIIGVVAIGVAALSVGCSEEGDEYKPAAEQHALEAEKAEEAMAKDPSFEATSEAKSHDAHHDEVAGSKPVKARGRAQEAKSNEVAEHGDDHGSAMQAAEKPHAKKQVARHGSVVEKKVSHHASGEAPAGTRFVVQIGAFKEKTNAENIYAKLKEEGFPVVMRALNHAKSGLLFVVHLSPFATRNEADEWQGKFEQKTGMKTQIITRMPASK